MVEINKRPLTRSVYSLPARERKHRRRSKRTRLFLLWLLTLLALSPIMIIAGYLTIVQQYERDKMLGKAGEEHLRAATNFLSSWSNRPFDVAPIQHAEQEFRVTGVLLSRVEDDLHKLPGLATQLPVFGPRLLVANRLVEAVQGLSQAGVAGCQLLQVVLPILTTPPGGHGKSLTRAEMTRIDQLLPNMNIGLLRALTSAEQLHPGDLSFDPHLAQKFASLQ